MKKILHLLIFLPILAFGQSLAPQTGSWVEENAVSLFSPGSIAPADERTAITDRSLQWLDAHLPDLKGKGVGCVLLKYTESPLGYHMQFQQTYNGIPVFGSQVMLSVGLSNNKIINVFYKTVNTQAWSASTTVPHPEMARIRSMVGSVDTLGVTRVWYIDKDRNPVAAYRVEFARFDGSIHKEQILDTEYKLLFEKEKSKSSGPKDTMVTAYVFFPDPLTSSHHIHGGNYVDDNDSGLFELNYEREPMSMTAKTDGDSFYLESPYMRLAEFSSPATPYTFSKSAIFNYSRSDFGFEDVNAFFHANRYHAYVNSIGFSKLGNYQVKYDAHALGGDDNSKFDYPGGPALYFGQGGIDDAEDADVIVHEYTHWLVYDALGWQDNTFGYEREAMEEGTCDYMACSYSKAITAYNSSRLYNWDGNESWDGRTCYTDKTWPRSKQNEIHYDGEVWSGSLMDIRDQLGRTKTDQLVLGSFAFLAKNISFDDAAKIIIQVDSLMFGGQDVKQIAWKFHEHGILPATYMGIENPSSPDDYKVLTAWFNQNNLLIVDFGAQQKGEAMLLDMQGRELLKQPFETSKLTLTTPALAPGVYLLQLSTQQGTRSVRLLKQ